MKMRKSNSQNRDDFVSTSINSKTTEPLWTVEDTAKYLRVTPETVRMMARDNKLPGIKVGKFWRFRAMDVKSEFILR
jgi:excisionase family DNA binding protein